MSSSPKPRPTTQISRNASAGELIGRTKDGIDIAKPDFRPNSFTVRQLERAIRAVREREDLASAG